MRVERSPKMHQQPINTREPDGDPGIEMILPQEIISVGVPDSAFESTPFHFYKTRSKDKRLQAIGVSVEGNALRLVKVVRGINRIEIDWLKTFSLPTASGTTAANDPLQPDDQVITNFETEDRASEVETQNLVHEGTGAFLQMVDLTEGGSIPLAIAVTEPDVYYDQFDTNWGLRGKYLLKKVASEMGLAKKSTGRLEHGEIRLVKMTSGRLLAIYCGRNLPFFTQMELVKKHFHRRLPKIGLVESVELSLVNLINDYFSPNEGVVTIIANVTPQTTRFTFMVGSEIYHLSPIISEGLASPNHLTTLLSRLQFELDNMSIRKVNEILIAGPIGISPTISMLKAHFPTAHVRPLRPHSLDLTRLGNDEVEDFGAYTPALGAALGLLDPQMDRSYHIDLTPAIVRDRQNRLSLSAAGWLLLLLIPALLVGILFEASRLNWELKQSRAELIPKQAQVEVSAEIDREIDAAGARLNSFEKANALLDSLQVGSVSFGATLTNLMQTCQSHDGSWFTEICSNDAGRMQMVGYSLNRADIPNFVRESGAEISKIEVQEIRNHPVYRFEIQSDIQVARN